MCCDQVMGLCPEAILFLKSFQEKCHCCEQIVPLKKEVIGECTGIYGSKYPLYRYYLASNFYADEFMQFGIWEPGSNIYLGLKVSDGMRYLWDEQAHNSCETSSCQRKQNQKAQDRCPRCKGRRRDSEIT